MVYNPISEEEGRQIKEDYLNGVLLSVMAKKYNRPDTTICELIKRNNLPMRFVDQRHGKEWKKLTRNSMPVNKNYWGRLLSLPSIIIQEAGFDPTKPLLGKWEVLEDGKLTLTLKYDFDKMLKEEDDNNKKKENNNLAAITVTDVVDKNVR